MYQFEQYQQLGQPLVQLERWACLALEIRTL
jgi:hypothetical protein